MKLWYVIVVALMLVLLVGGCSSPFQSPGEKVESGLVLPSELSSSEQPPSLPEAGDDLGTPLPVLPS